MLPPFSCVTREPSVRKNRRHVSPLFLSARGSHVIPLDTPADQGLGPWSTTGNAAGKQLGFAKEEFSQQESSDRYIMPPLFKIMFILLGIAPLLRLVITLAMMTCGMAVILWLAIVFQVMFKTSAALVVVYSIFSLILISLATVKTKTENQQRRRSSFALLKNSALRLVGVGF